MQYGLQNAVRSAKYYRLQTKKTAKHTCKICFTTDRRNQVSNNSVVLKTEGSDVSVQESGEKENGRGNPLKNVPSHEKQLCFLKGDQL